MTDTLTGPPEVRGQRADSSPPDPADGDHATNPPGPREEPDGGWDRVRVIEALRSAAAREREAEVDQFALIAAAADVYSWVDNMEDVGDIWEGRTPRERFGERLWQFGADGTPEAAEFLTYEVGPALGISPDSAASLIADVLDLRHRLPRTWQLLLQGRVLGWLARRIAQNTRQFDLSQEITWELDRHIAPFLEGWTPRQTLLRVAMLIARLDPEGTEERRRQTIADRFVCIDQGESGTATVRGQVDGPAGLALDQTLDDLAEVLAAGGMDGTPRELRAAAMEALADPTYAADLLNGVIAHEPTDDTDTDTSEGDADTDAEPDARAGTGQSTASGSGRVVQFGSPWQIGTLKLDLHLQLSDLVNGAGGQSAQLGEVALSQIRELISRAGKVVVTPVLDPLAPQGVDGYEVPDRIARAVKLRNPTVVFPFSNRSSASKHVQCDHVIPHPDGPTHTDNLGPLDPRAHRVKTFGGYRKVTLRAGVFEWTTPTGQRYWLTPHGTFRANPDTTPPPRRVRLTDRAGDALRRGTSHQGPGEPPAQGMADPERVRDTLPTESLQPVLIPDPDPRPHWKGTMKPPDLPKPHSGPPPF